MAAGFPWLNTAPTYASAEALLYKFLRPSVSSPDLSAPIKGAETLEIS